MSIVNWLLNLGSVFFRNAPLPTLTVILMTLVAQVSMMLALLLPLKVVMLLGSGNVPRFFPEVLLQFDRETLVIVLGLVALGFYGLHIVTSRISRYACDRGVDKLLLQSHKVVLFENQDKIASNAYQKFAEALANLTFSILSLIVFWLFYPLVALLLGTYFLLIAILVSSLITFSNEWQNRLSRQAAVITLNLNNLGFLLIFVTIVADFLYFSPPPFLVALLSVILCRLMLVRTGMGINDLLGLHKQEAKIKALFFAEHVFVPVSHDTHENIWSMLKQPYRDQWLRELLSDLSSQRLETLHVEWLQCRYKSGLFLRASSTDSDESRLIKLFDPNATMAALHEATLLTDVIDLPAPKLSLVTKIADYQCHVFNIDVSGLTTSKPSQNLLQDFLTKLLAITPPDNLVERYQRSHIMLWEQLQRSLFQRVMLIADESQQEVIQHFETAWSDIVQRLSALPLVFNNPTNNSLFFTTSSGEPICFDWGKWTLGPAGSAWNADNLDELDNALQQAATHRSELLEKPACDYYLAAYTSSMLENFKAQQYYDVIKLMEKMLVILDDANNAVTSAELQL